MQNERRETRELHVAEENLRARISICGYEYEDIGKDMKTKPRMQGGRTGKVCRNGSCREFFANKHVADVQHSEGNIQYREHCQCLEVVYME